MNEVKEGTLEEDALTMRSSKGIAALKPVNNMTCSAIVDIANNN